MSKPNSLTAMRFKSATMCLAAVLAAWLLTADVAALADPPGTAGRRPNGTSPLPSR